MKKLLFASVLLLGFPHFAYGQSDDVKRLMQREETLNDMCRGGSGNDADTLKACDLRDNVLNKIKDKGWCWGPDDVAGYEKHWVECKQTKPNTVNTFLNPWILSSSKDSILITYKKCNGACPTSKTTEENLNDYVNQLQYAFIILVNKNISYPLLTINIATKSQDNTIFLEIGNYQIYLKKFLHAANMNFYNYEIPYQETKDFIHAFTSNKYGYVIINNNKQSIDLKGTSKVINDFIQETENQHISLPPPFKSFSK